MVSGEQSLHYYESKNMGKMSHTMNQVITRSTDKCIQIAIIQGRK